MEMSPAVGICMLSSSAVSEHSPMPMQQAHPQSGAVALPQLRLDRCILSRSLPMFATHKQLLGFSHSCGAARSSSTGSEGVSESASTNRLSLQDALNKIVDVAVEKVGAVFAIPKTWFSHSPCSTAHGCLHPTDHLNQQ